MQYIVLDLEWNQAWPGSHSALRNPGLHGEIIQIGAVMLTESLRPGVEYQQLVAPKFFKRLNKRVSTLTGIDETDLLAGGLPFPEVIEEFKVWCGDSPVLLTWGYDDIPILRENLEAHGLPTDWTDNWYNLQLIFNEQTDGSTGQKSLSTAMEHFDIHPCRRAHDALGDAYHTAVVCTRLDLKKGIKNYGRTRKKSEDFSAEIPGCISRKVFDGFEGKEQALSAMSGRENLCPVCKKKMTAGKWLSQTGRRYVTMMTCPKHGEFFVRVRLIYGEDENGLGTVQAVRLCYDSHSETAESYREREARRNPPEKKDSTSAKPRRRRFRFPGFRFKAEQGEES